MRSIIPLAICALTACAPPTTSIQGAAVDALVALPPAQFAATLGLATEVAQGCPDYRFSPERQDLIIAARAASGTASVANARPVGIALEIDVARRSFQARHNLTVGQDNTCAAIAADTAANRPISAVLVRG